MRALNWLVIVAMCATTGCGSCGKKADKGETPPTIEPEGPYVLPDDAPDGLWMKVTEGKNVRPTQERNKVPKTKKLNIAEANNVLARLSELKTEATDTKSFALREGSLPPPRTGGTIDDKFPPAVDAKPPVEGYGQALEIVRFAPEGDVDLAPYLSVTFNQPMVAVTSHADSIKNLPVSLKPQPEGEWRWIGTRTLLFDPELRFPQATEYQVEVKEGAKATTGKALATGKNFTFTTPAPTIKSSYPPYGAVQGADPLIVIAFDQRIDAKAVLPNLEVRARGETFKFRAATDKEIESDESVSRFVDSLKKSEQDGRYVVIRPLGQLPLDSESRVTVAKGTPSAEGPLATREEQSFTFRTYGPFEVDKSRCGYECRPGTSWNFNLSNPIDQETLKNEEIQVTPKVRGMRVDVRGRIISISGDSHANTKYTVSLPTSMKDTFGQSLSKNESTFAVGEARPRLWGPQGLVVLDPAAKKPTLDVFSVNHEKLRVRIQKVTPSDYGDYLDFTDGYYGAEKPGPPPGKSVFNKQIKIAKDDSQFVETSIDLAPALTNNLGHAVVIIETLRPRGKRDRDWYPTTHTAWVQVTKIGLDLQSDTKGLVAFATNLADGTPLEGVSLSLRSGRSSRNSDAKGIARFSGGVDEQASFLLGTRGEDTAFLTAGSGSYGRFQPYREPTHSGWFVYNDRGMYRPGETVHLKGWLRSIGSESDSDVEMTQAKEATYVVTGPRGNEITKGTAAINALGGFDTKFELPTTPNLGRARVQFYANGAPSFSHNFQIEEFRRPEFEVRVEASPGPHLIGSQSSITATAKYLAGGVLPSADVSWFVQAKPGSFTPPNQDEFTFGTWVPWWHHRGSSKGKNSGNKSNESVTSKTTASGEHTIDIDFLSVKPPRPMSVVAQASVSDLNRQTWSSSATLLVHPADLYVGLKRDRYFVERGTPMTVKSLVVDHDGKAALGTEVVVTAALKQWTYKDGEWTTVLQSSEECKFVSTGEAHECSFASLVGGRYDITASMVDARGRPNQSQTTMWVSGGKTPASRNVEQEAITLIPDKKQYRPGDTAKILVQSPFAPAEGVVSLRRSGLVSTERVTLTQSGTTIEVPILDAHTPNIIVQVDLVGAAARLDEKGEPAPGLPKRPAYATGEIDLSVPPDHRALQVQVTPAKDQLEPGGETTLKLFVQDAKNEPVAGAELSVVVVDESVLSLSAYKTPEPLLAFYPKRQEAVSDHHNRQYLKLARADASVLASTEQGPSGGATGWGTIGTGNYGTIGHGSGTGSGYGRGAPPMAPGKMGKRESTRATGQFAMKRNSADPQLARAAAMDSARQSGLLAIGGEANNNAPSIDVRSNFNALAVFAPEVRTDKSGRATVSVKLPDNLTRYRVMVAAAAGAKQFGHGESSITARKSMMVRPSPPRFLNFGDEFQLPVVLQNQTDTPLTVNVAVRAQNAKLVDGNGRQVVVPANDRVEVLFPARTKMPGTARFQVGASAGQWSDANEFSFPVWTPATTEGFATYGEVDSGSIRQAVSMPSGVIKEFGELQVTTSSTQLQALTDAVLYLVGYKFECAEQLSSRVLAVAALRDVLTAFEAKGLPSPEEMEAAVRRDLKRLHGRQKYNGSFGFWTRRDQAGPYTSIHVAHAMARAKNKGFTIPPSMLSRSTDYLRSIERHISHYASPSTKHTLTAYALFVRTLLDDKDTAGARKLIRDVGVERLPMQALGWLLYTMSSDQSSSKERAAIHKHLNSKISETAATATFATSVSDGDHVILHSSRRTDGVILEALIADQPESDLILKVTRGLLANRTRGHWGNTQDNAFVLLALDRYFETYEKTVPKFVARTWLGDAYAGEHKFVGRTTERHQINVPLSYLAEGSQERDVLLQKDGEGRMYYRIGMNYALEDLRLEAADHGFAVQRQYEHVDDKDDVVKLPDGSWKFKAGAKVRVRLTMVATSRRYQVALVDPLPGGLEPMNPALAVTGAIPADENQRSPSSRYWWWSRPWFEHQNMRDERVEAFTSILWAGVHEYTYVGLATTPGSYTVPPTKAEEMYTPETFGRSATDKVTIH